MNLPWVKIDLTRNEFYQKNNYEPMLKVFWAEILMLNLNTGTARVRLYDLETKELFQGNYNTCIRFFVGDEINIKISEVS